MRNSLRLAAVSTVFCFGLGTGIANAGVFDGQTVNVQYFFPDLSSPYDGLANGNYFVDSSVEVINVVDIFGTLDFSGDGFVISFFSNFTLNSGSFNGLVVSDALSTMAPFTSFSILSNTSSTGIPPFLSFDADHLYVNWEGQGFKAGELVFSVSVVPEPETYTMLLVGLGLLCFMTPRRKEPAV